MNPADLTTPPSDQFESLFTLRFATTKAWTDTVLGSFELFLNDHAQAEKKASGMAMSMVSHYPDRKVLVHSMLDLAIEELCHFKEVVKLLHERGLTLGPDKKDAYVNQIRALTRDGTDVYLLDRLLCAAIIEARGCERFGLIGRYSKDVKMHTFYQAIAASEERHHWLFVNLALKYFDQQTVTERLDELLDQEASILCKLPIRAALH